MDFDHPSALCDKLAAGKLDVALVSSFEFLRNPIYQIVDDVSISSNGPVYSVVVAHHGKIAGIDEIKLDPASETSVNLLRCLIAELGLRSRLQGTTHEARLLIGDQAIRFRQERAKEFSFWDIGEQWQKLVGLPFVYALWLVRPEIADPEQLANRLRAVRDQNVANLDALIAETVAGVAAHGPQRGLTGEFFSLYYRQHLCFGFGDKEKEGLRVFAKLCVKHGLLPKRDSKFRVV